MTIETITIRKANQKDASDLAIIDNMSSGGMSYRFWEHAVNEGEADDPLIYARKQYTDANSIFGWSNAFIAEDEKDILGAITAYEMVEPDENVDEINQLFPDLVPVFELFGKVVGDWFIDSLGTFPSARGKGVATMLLEAALKEGIARKYPCAALVVESENETAKALYKKMNFSAVTSIPQIGDGANGNWLLMKTEL